MMMMRKYVSKCHKCTAVNEKNEIYYTFIESLARLHQLLIMKVFFALIEK